MIQVVKNGEPYAVEALEYALATAKENRIEGLCLMYLIDGKIYTEYTKADGTTITELLGCVEIMRSELLEAMKL